MPTYVRMAGALVLRKIMPPSVTFQPPAATYLLDYQTGDWSQWGNRDYNRPEQEAIVTSPARSGYPYSARFIVAPGDHTFGQVNEERAEVSATPTTTGNPADGGSQWFSWSSFFPTGTYVDAAPHWLAFTQWHHTASSGVPNVAFLMNPGTPVTAQLVVRGQSIDLNTGAVGYNHEWGLGEVLINSWNDFVVHIRWNSDPALGGVTVKLNGTTVADVTCPTLYAGYSAYMKQGIYRANSTRTHTIYHTGTRRGSTEASVRL